MERWEEETNKNKASSLASPICAIQQSCDDKCRVVQMSLQMSVWMSQKSKISGNFILRSSVQNPDDKRITTIGVTWAAIIPQTKKCTCEKLKTRERRCKQLDGFPCWVLHKWQRGKGTAKNDFTEGMDGIRKRWVRGDEMWEEFVRN